MALNFIQEIFGQFDNWVDQYISARLTSRSKTLVLVAKNYAKTYIKVFCFYAVLR